MSSTSAEKKDQRLIEFEGSRARYLQIVGKGTDYLAKHPLPDPREAQPQHVDIMFNLLKEIAPFAHSGVLPSWWEHTYAAPSMAIELSKALQQAGIDTNPYANGVTMVGHDWGRLVIPARQYVNDWVNQRMLRDMGIPKSYGERMIPTKAIINAAIPFEKLTVEQRITNLADNLAKRTPDGTLFDEVMCFAYLDQESIRYPDKSQALWRLEEKFIDNRQTAIGYQKQILSQTFKWLKEMGINFEDIREKVIPVAPSVIYLTRHGDTNNQGMVYNLDEYTDSPIQITDLGRNQMKGLAGAIKQRRVVINNIVCSNQLRANQSAQTLANGLHYSNTVATNSQLRDVDAPAILIPGRFKSMAEFEEIGVPGMYYPENIHYMDSASGKQIENETLEALQTRMLNTIEEILKQKQTNGSNHTIIVSHGDSIRAAIAGFDGNLNLSPEYHRDNWEKDYLKKGEMWELIYDPDGSYVTRFRFPENKTL